MEINTKTVPISISLKAFTFGRGVRILGKNTPQNPVQNVCLKPRFKKNIRECHLHPPPPHEANRPKLNIKLEECQDTDRGEQNRRKIQSQEERKTRYH